jgi:hypothetical protein
MPNVSSTSCRPHALRKVAERLQRGKRYESPNGSHVVVTQKVVRLCNLIRNLDFFFPDVCS